MTIRRPWLWASSKPSMDPETRQTLIAIIGLTMVQMTNLAKGYNGTVTMAYFVAVLAVITPEALDKLPTWSSG